MINNESTSVRGLIAREIVANILVHRDFSSAFPAKLIIERDWIRTENWCKPRRHGQILADEFTPYPKNPLLASFFVNIGHADALGSGVRNLYKYTPIYTQGGKPELFEDDVFRIAIPLNEDAVKEEKKLTELTEREQQIYNMIIKNPKINIDEIAAELDVTRRTILRNVQEMKKKVYLAYDKKNTVWKY